MTPHCLSLFLSLLQFLFLLSPSILLLFLLQHAAILALLRSPFSSQLELFVHLIFKDTRIARSVPCSLSLSLFSPSLSPYSLLLSAPPVSLPFLSTPFFFQEFHTCAITEVSQHFYSFIWKCKQGKSAVKFGNNNFVFTCIFPLISLHDKHCHVSV